MRRKCRLAKLGLPYNISDETLNKFLDQNRRRREKLSDRRT